MGIAATSRTAKTLSTIDAVHGTPTRRAASRMASAMVAGCAGWSSMGLPAAIRAAQGPWLNATNAMAAASARPTAKIAAHLVAAMVAAILHAPRIRTERRT